MGKNLSLVSESSRLLGNTLIALAGPYGPFLQSDMKNYLVSTDDDGNLDFLSSSFLVMLFFLHRRLVLSWLTCSTKRVLVLGDSVMGLWAFIYK